MTTGAGGVGHCAGGAGAASAVGHPSRRFVRCCVVVSFCCRAAFINSWLSFLMTSWNIAVVVQLQQRGGGPPAASRLAQVQRRAAPLSWSAVFFQKYI